jgi:hypothetical protein
MTRWIGAAMLAATLMFGGSAAIDTAAAASLQAAVQQPGASDATDLSARRRVHDRRYANRSYDRPYYYDRPTYYRPYPYAVPVPFFLGFGFGPLW